MCPASGHPWVTVKVGQPGLCSPTQPQWLYPPDTHPFGPLEEDMGPMEPGQERLRRWRTVKPEVSKEGGLS